MLSFLPEHYLLSCSLFLLCYGITFGLSATIKFPFLYKNTIFLGILILLNFMFFNMEDFIVNNIYYNFFFLKDQSTTIIQVILTILSMIILITSYFYNKNNSILYWEYPILIIFSITSVFFLVGSNEIISFYFLLEFQSICFYILAAYNRKSKKSLESGIKYFIMGSFSSILLLLGFSFIYALTGLTHFEDLYVFFSSSQNPSFIMLLAMVLILVAFMFKIYAAPFHFWVADVYQGAPTSSVLFFATIPLLAFVLILYKFYFIFFINYTEMWKLFFLVTCMCSLIMGTLGALYQQYIKKLLAYSSIMNMGFVTAGFLVTNPIVIQHNINYIVLYIINTLAVLILFSNMYLVNEKKNAELISNYVGFFKQNKFISVLIMCFFYSLAGLPPFSFFFGKLMLLTSLMNTDVSFIVYPIIITTLIGSFYYLRVVQLMSYSNQKQWIHVKPISYITLFMIICITFVNLLYLGNYSNLGILTYYISLELYL